MSHRLFWVLLVCCFAGIGCKKNPEVASIPGYVETQSSGVAISLPADLTVTDLTKTDLAEIKNEAGAKFSSQPAVGKIVEQLATSGSMKLVARSATATSGGFQKSFSLVVQPVSGNLTAESLIDANRIQMKAVAVPGSLNVELRKYSAGSAGYFQFDLLSGGVSHTQTTYIFVHDAKEYVFTFSSSTSDKESWGAVAETSIKSVHFVS